MPPPRKGENPTKLLKMLMLDKYGVKVRDDELGIVHRYGERGRKLLAEFIQRHDYSSFQRILPQRGGGNPHLKVQIYTFQNYFYL